MSRVKSTSDSAPAAAPTSEGHRVVPCRRCREPLFFPTGYSAQHRAPVMFCRKCGAQTRLPMKNRWIFAVLAVLVFVAAWIFVILTYIKEDDLMP